MQVGRGSCEEEEEAGPICGITAPVSGEAGGRGSGSAA